LATYFPFRSNDSNPRHFIRSLFRQYRNNAVASGRHDLLRSAEARGEINHFASQSSGDAIAAPFCPTLDWEDAFFDDLGGRSGNRIAIGADQAVFMKERRDAVIELGPDCPAPSSEPRSQCAAVDWSSRHNEPVRLSSKPNPWGCRIAAVTTIAEGYRNFSSRGRICAGEADVGIDG
jgi:hypothetical protein